MGDHFCPIFTKSQLDGTLQMATKACSLCGMVDVPGFKTEGDWLLGFVKANAFLPILLY